MNTIDDTTTIIDADTLKAWVERHDDVVVIDVRSAAEFESLHIRGSYNVPLPLLSEHTEDVAQRVGRRVVLVCHSGVRAEQARMRLHEVGMDSAVVLGGGAPAYAAAGGEVVEPPVTTGPVVAAHGDWPGRAHGLTQRQAEVVSLISQGLTNQEIVERTYITLNTLKTYIRQAYLRIGVTTRAQAVLWGVEHGMLPRTNKEGDAAEAELEG